MCSVLSAAGHLPASALQTTRRQQARGASRLGKRKALQPAAPADAANPGTIGPPSSAPSRLRGKAAPQQQRTQASEPQALLGRRVHKHFEEGWFEVNVFKGVWKPSLNSLARWQLPMQSVSTNPLKMPLHNAHVITLGSKAAHED